MKNRHHVLQCLNSFVQHLIVDLKRIRIRIIDRGGLPWLWNTEGIYRSKINACASLLKLIYPAIVFAAALNMCWMLLPKNMMDQINIFALHRSVQDSRGKCTRVRWIWILPHQKRNKQRSASTWENWMTLSPFISVSMEWKVGRSTQVR